MFRFGVFELDARSSELRKSGVRVALQGQPVQILVLLLQHSGELVTRDELKRHLWPNEVFGSFEHGLNAAVGRLRETLGDSADGPRYIETLPRRGYRYIGPTCRAVAFARTNATLSSAPQAAEEERQSSWSEVLSFRGILRHLPVARLRRSARSADLRDELVGNPTFRDFRIRSLSVFCGSRPGAQSAYADAARVMGRTLAARGIRLVYGGGDVGLMGVIADATVAAGGDVVGVITEGLQQRQVGHKGLAELRVVPTMHERKAVMSSLSDAFVALPGGAGTLDELFEAWTCTQLGIHRKPVGFLNTAGYYDPLFTFLERAVAQRFIRADDYAAVIVESEPQALLDRLATATLPWADKWTDRGGARP